LATSTFENGAISRVFSLPMSLADRLTLVLAVLIAAMTTDWCDGRVAVGATWPSGLDYARLAPGLLGGRTASP
jgi:hypothetical protein